MLAAKHAFNQSTLDLFRLALSMVENQETNIPSTLKDYFSDILNEAKMLANDPSKISQETKPEAIELAVEFLAYKDLLSELNDLDNIESVSPAMAKQLLEKMEVDPVRKNGFGAFTGFAG